MTTVPTRLLSPEARLLLLTAGGTANDPAIAEIAQEADWHRLTRLAESERAEPVLVRRLRSVGIPLPPEAARLEQLARVVDFRQAWIEDRLGASVRVLAKHGIDVVLLKGAALAVSEYGSFLDRPMADLDLLVERERAEEAHRLLRGAGWAWKHNPELDAFYATHHHLAPLHDASGVGIGLDLHLTPVCAGSPFGLTGEVMRGRAVPIPLKGATAYVPEIHDQLLHLCVHFAWSHLLASGAWRTFRDVSTLVDSGRIDWSVFLDRARAHRATSCCYWTLRLAERLAGLRLPREVLSSLRPPVGRSVVFALERHYLLNLLPAESTAASVRLISALWSAGMQPVRMGHGSARPWDRTTAYFASRAGARPAGRPSMSSRLRRLRTLGVYTRAMLGAG